MSDQPNAIQNNIIQIAQDIIKNKISVNRNVVINKIEEHGRTSNI